MFNKYKSKNQNGKGIKIYTMEEPIITFGSESLILEMFPEFHEPIPDPIPEPIEHIPETIIEIVPETNHEPVKRWCVIS